MAPQPGEAPGATAPGVMGLLMRLRALGITDADLLKQVETARRDQFVPVEHSLVAFDDMPLPIRCGQTMPSPDLTVRLVEALDVLSHHSVLEIGTGSGFQTAILAQRARKVRTVDRYKTLLDGARRTLDRLGLTNVTYHQADGREEVADNALFDRIIVDSAYTATPRALLATLVAGGTVITAMGASGDEQMLVRLTKIGNRFERENLFPVRFSALETGVAAAF